MTEKELPVFSLCFCSACFLLLLDAHCVATRPSEPLKPVIIDTDIGSYVDDSYAISFSLQNREYLDIKLIVTCTDDTTTRAKIAAKLLTITGHDDIPLGIGVWNNNVTNHTLWDWASDFNLSDYKGGVYEDGIDQMAKIILGSETVVDIIAIGPMTNFPLLLERYPDVVKNARIRAMAGSIYRGYDNSTVPTAEYNVRMCPHCLDIVLKAGWDIDITPLDTTGVATMTPGYVQELIASSSVWSNVLDAHMLFWCSKGIIPCHLNTATITLPDPVTLLLVLPNTNDYIELEELNLTVTEKGYVKINDTCGIPTQVALYWRENLVGLDMYRKYITTVLSQS